MEGGLPKTARKSAGQRGIIGVTWVTCQSKGRDHSTSILRLCGWRDSSCVSTLARYDKGIETLPLRRLAFATSVESGVSTAPPIETETSMHFLKVFVTSVT